MRKVSPLCTVGVQRLFSHYSSPDWQTEGDVCSLEGGTSLFWIRTSPSSQLFLLHVRRVVWWKYLTHVSENQGLFVKLMFSVSICFCVSRFNIELTIIRQALLKVCKESSSFPELTWKPNLTLHETVTAVISIEGNLVKTGGIAAAGILTSIHLHFFHCTLKG